MMSAASLLIRRQQRHRFFRGSVVGEWARRWLSSMETIKAQGAEKPPLLMVSSSSASSPASRCLYNLTKDVKSHISDLERHRHDLTLPAGIIPYEDYSLAGSSRGFLFFTPKSTGGGDILAINPLTAAHFRLPPVPDNPELDSKSLPDPGPKMRVVLSPSLQTAVLLRQSNGNSRAEFTRLPSSSSSSQWTPFSVAPHIARVHDCTFHKDRLYFIDHFHRVAAFDEDVFANHPPSGGLRPSAIWSYDELPGRSDLVLSIHFVESPNGDDLSLVFRCAGLRGGLPCKSMRWWVYKRDDDGRGWKPVKSIGDSALFMGAYGGMFLPVDPHGSCVLERDCVYFTDRPNPRLPIQEGLVDTGMYHFEDGTVEFLPVTDSGKILDFSPPVWLPSAAC